MAIPTTSSINADDALAITHLVPADGICLGRFVSWSADGINVKVETGLTVGALVKLESTDDLMVAEVCDCEADGQEYSAGLFLIEWIEKSRLEQLRREVTTGIAA